MESQVRGQGRCKGSGVRGRFTGLGSVLRVGVGIQGWIRYTGLGLVDRVGVGIQGWGR